MTVGQRQFFHVADGAAVGGGAKLQCATVGTVAAANIIIAATAALFATFIFLSITVVLSTKSAN